MAVRLWPDDYKNRDHITKTCKQLMSFAEKYITEGHFTVNIDPLGLSNDKYRFGMYISPNRGLLTFTVYNEPIDVSLLSAYKIYAEMCEKQISARLLDSKALISRNGAYKRLRFPYKHILVFQNESYATVKDKLAELTPLKDYLSLQFMYPIDLRGKVNSIDQLKIFDVVRLPYDEAFSEISELECRAIFERLAPEYVITIPEKEPVTIPTTNAAHTDEELMITGREQEYKTFFLDEYQVNLVNEMGTGHRVILANPGAGKSVILLSKAFKYASLYKDSKVLLTCYNNNLASSYKFKKACANFGQNNNLYILTLHKLVEKIYNELLHEKLSGNFAKDEEVQHCLDMVQSGAVTLRFKAIFIDEVQNFAPLYLELCYALLDPEEGNLFLMAGDLNQDIRSNSRKGNVPWKQMRDVSLDFTGRVRYIEKNYRNSYRISKYIEGMLSTINSRLEMLNLIVSREFKYDTFVPGDKETVAFCVKSRIYRYEIKEEIKNAVRELTQTYKIPYSDIAILFPFRQTPYLKYNTLFWIKSALNEEKIPYSLIINDENRLAVRYGQTTGIIISTIDSSLGLDFRAVILTGLYPYNYVNLNGMVKEEIKDWATIARLPEESKLAVQRQMHAVYTACSRARDALYVLSDFNPGTPMEMILKEQEHGK